MKLNAIRISLIGGALLLTPLVVSAQDPSMPGSNPGANPSSPGSQTTPGVKNSNGSVFGEDSSGNNSGGPDTLLMRDKIFLNEVAEGAVAEAQLGKLASTRASNADVKSFGQTLVDDHAALTATMKPIAADLGTSLPTKMDKADQAEYMKLKALSGADFDKEFLLYMVTEHRRDLKDYRDEVMSTSDKALRDAAIDSAKMVYAHIKTAFALAKANGVTLPPTTPRPTP